ERRIQAANGREMLLRKFKNWKLNLNDEAIRKILKKYNLKLAADFYYELASGKIDPLEVKSIFTEATEESSKDKMEELLPKSNIRNFSFDDGEDYLIIDENLKNVNYKLAKCCSPVFGDSVFGFVTISEGIKIHRSSCPNAPQMKERFPYRLINAKWKNTESPGSFLTTIYISGTDQVGVISEISHIIAKDTGARLRSINIESDREKFEGTMKISVFNTNHLEFLIHKINSVKGVTSVSRGEN
ncbi:MAG: ACT domain-containing protein, partial [Prolixibacteraceae bacterium]